VNDLETAFQNPWPSAGKPTWGELWQMSNPLGWTSQNLANDPNAEDVNVVEPDWGSSSLKEQDVEKNKCIVGTWLGHASAMVQLPVDGAARTGGDLEKKSLWIMFDPIFSMRAGPTQYTGPRRLRPPPCQVEDLPACDAVIISHNHYDHLDLSSIQAIFKKFPKCRYFVPLGNKTWFTSLGIPDDLVHQLDWWQHRELLPHHFGFKVEHGAVEETIFKITSVPAQHTSGRGALDQDTTLWSGWVIEQILHSKDSLASSNIKRIRKGATYYAGDTGLRRTSRSEDLCPAFDEIGKKLGPFDLSLIPIWRGGTLSFLSSVGLELSHDGTSTALHVTPLDAMFIHRTVGSRNTIPVHFGTFIGSEDESYESTISFNKARKREEVGKFGDKDGGKCGRSGILNIGGSIAVEIEEMPLS